MLINWIYLGGGIIISGLWLTVVVYKVAYNKGIGRGYQEGIADIEAHARDFDKKYKALDHKWAEAYNKLESEHTAYVLEHGGE